MACHFSCLWYKVAVEKADVNLILFGSQGLHALCSRCPQECFPFFGSHIILLGCVLPLVVINRWSEVMCTSDKPNPSALDYSLWDYQIQYLLFPPHAGFPLWFHIGWNCLPYGQFLTHSCSCYFLPDFLHYLLIYFFHFYLFSLCFHLLCLFFLVLLLL